MITDNDKQKVVDNLLSCGIINDKKNTYDKFKNGCLSFRVPKTNNLPSNVNDVFVSLIFNIKHGEDNLNIEEKERIKKETKNANMRFLVILNLNLTFIYRAKMTKELSI